MHLRHCQRESRPDCRGRRLLFYRVARACCPHCRSLFPSCPFFVWWLSLSLLVFSGPSFDPAELDFPVSSLASVLPPSSPSVTLAPPCFLSLSLRHHEQSFNCYAPSLPSLSSSLSALPPTRDQPGRPPPGRVPAPSRSFPPSCTHPFHESDHSALHAGQRVRRGGRRREDGGPTPLIFFPSTQQGLPWLGKILHIPTVILRFLRHAWSDRPHPPSLPPSSGPSFPSFPLSSPSSLLRLPPLSWERVRPPLVELEEEEKESLLRRLHELKFKMPDPGAC